MFIRHSQILKSQIDIQSILLYVLYIYQSPPISDNLGISKPTCEGHMYQVLWADQTQSVGPRFPY